MSLLDLARELGSQIQMDEAYVDYNIAKQNYEADKELQQAIEKFNLDKVSLNYELSKSNSDQEKIEQLNNKIQNQYATLMNNENMKNYNDSKMELNNLLRKIITILNYSAEGENPFTLDVDALCGGNCSSCQGC